MKRRIVFLSFAVICSILSYSIAFADDNNVSNVVDVSALAVTDLNVSQNDVTIDNNGSSKFIDVTATMSDNSKINVNSEAVWTTDDQNVAIAIAGEGRILAQGKGKTQITVSYGGLEKTINVNVLKTVDLFEEVKVAYENYKNGLLGNDAASANALSSSSLTPAEREAIHDRAMDMLSYLWIPTQDLIGWKSQYIFTGNTGHLGIPYTQNIQVDDSGFAQALSYSDFYKPVSFNQSGVTYKEPRYGNDCSGFTSFSWGISRIDTYDFFTGLQNGTYPKVGSYDSSSYNSASTADLKKAYKQMQLGDAVVMRTSNASSGSGHVFIIAVNFTDQSKVQCFEQTPPYCQITNWTYDDLARLHYYPFSKK